MFETLLKKFIIYIFIVIIFIYHTIQIFQPEMIQKDISSIISLVEWVFLILFAFISFDSKFVHKLILRDKYLGGVYVGQSYYLDIDGKVIEDKVGRKMEFTINQTLTKLDIDGLSKAIDNQNSYDTSWKGYFYKHDKSSYLFALEVDYGSHEIGNLELIFNKNFDEEFLGFYYSGDANSLNQKIVFRKKEDING